MYDNNNIKTGKGEIKVLTLFINWHNFTTYAILV